MRQLSPDGAEFLVLGNLLARGIYAYKNYINTPDYDVAALNPKNRKIAKIEVKSKKYKDAKIYKLKSLKIDFVVFVQLNEYIKRKIRGKRKIIPIDPEINPINYTIIPIKKIRSLITRRKKRSKSGNYSISLTSLYRNKTIKKYQNHSGWALIKKFLKIRS